MESVMLAIKKHIIGRIHRALVSDMLFAGIAQFITALVLSLFSPYDGIAPFGAACASAVWHAGIYPYFACIGSAIGSLLSRNYGYAVVSVAYAASAYLFKKRNINPARLYKILLLAGAEVIILPFFLGFSLSGFTDALASAAVSVAAAIVIGHGMLGLRSALGGRTMNDAELLTLAVTAGLITLSLGNFSLLGQSPAMVFAGLCALFAAYRFGASGVAVAVVVAAGRVMATGADMLFIALLAASTLVSAAVRSVSKWASLAGFSLVCLLFTIFVNGACVFSYVEIIIICLIFSAVPEELYCASGYRSVAGSERFEYRISSLAEVLRELARVYSHEDGQLLLSVSDTLRGLLAPQTKQAGHYSVTVGCADCAKLGSNETGDSHTIRDLDGQILLALSDGMGSGSDARRESSEALALLTDLLSVGFTMDNATEFVNRLLVRRSNGDMYATLDAALIDPCSATVKLAKHGAPPSYVLRRRKVHTLYAEALPVGILEAAASQTRQIKLERGDVFIMMTDGVSDALGSRLVATITDSIHGGTAADNAAQAILASAMAGGYDDDMTVLVAKIS